MFFPSRMCKILKGYVILINPFPPDKSPLSAGHPVINKALRTPPLFTSSGAASAAEKAEAQEARIFFYPLGGPSILPARCVAAFANGILIKGKRTRRARL